MNLMVIWLLHLAASSSRFLLNFLCSSEDRRGPQLEGTLIGRLKQFQWNFSPNKFAGQWEFKMATLCSLQVNDGLALFVSKATFIWPQKSRTRLLPAAFRMFVAFNGADWVPIANKLGAPMTVLGKAFAVFNECFWGAPAYHGRQPLAGRSLMKSFAKFHVILTKIAKSSTKEFWKQFDSPASRICRAFYRTRKSVNAVYLCDMSGRPLMLRIMR